MKIEAWWFENRQEEEIQLPGGMAFTTHFGIYAELGEISCPFTISVSAAQKGQEIYHGEFVIEKEQRPEDVYEIESFRNGFVFKGIARDIAGLPDRMHVEVRMPEKSYQEDICCEYACLQGKITDFDGNPFPAAVIFSRIGFARKYVIGTMSNQNGEYSVVVPKGCYNAVFVDDDSYGVTTLENWSWHMLVDRDEEHDFKVGNGEIYSLSPWCSNGGSSTLFFWFRPMMLPSIRQSEYEIELNGEKRKVQDISPELEPEDITVTINGSSLKVISLQKVYETGEGYTMPSYLLQTERLSGSQAVGKQTVILEYDTAGRSGTLGYTARSQGRYQFYYKDCCANTLQ